MGAVGRPATKNHDGRGTTHPDGRSIIFVAWYQPETK